MVQIINDPYSGNAFGRIGKGLGQALSEQVPKEVERLRLASGLKKFEEQSSGLTPVQQFTRLAAIPGISPEHLYTIAPLLRQQATREEGISRIRSNLNTPNEKENTQQTESALPLGNAGEAADKRALKTLSATQSQLTPIVQKSPQELFSEAALLSQQNPNTYPTPNDAMPFVQAQEKTRIDNLNEQRSVANTADKIQQELRSRLVATMGGEKTAQGVPGTVQTRLLRNIEDELANPKNKLSEQHIIDKWAAKGKRIAQAQTNLDTRSKGGWLAKLGSIGGVAGAAASTIGAEYLPKRIRDTIEATRKVYHEAEADEEFQDIIASKFDLTSAGSAYFTYPRENETINKYIASLKIPKKGSSNDRTALEAADFISRNLSSQDSILSYAMELKKKGIDPQVFFDRMNQNAEAGLYMPNPRQQNEFQKGYPSLPSLGDMYIFSLTKQNKLASP